MKKFTGRYTTNTAKALKGSERILCQVSEDGTIYICNGFLLCTMNAPEYAATVQPLTCCEPGAWTFDKDGKHEDEAHKLDLVKLFADTVRDTADAAPLVQEREREDQHEKLLPWHYKLAKLVDCEIYQASEDATRKDPLLLALIDFSRVYAHFLVSNTADYNAAPWGTI